MISEQLHPSAHQSRVQPITLGKEGILVDVDDPAERGSVLPCPGGGQEIVLEEVADTEQESFDAFGRVVWSQDADGFLTYRGYDQVTGALVQQIQDVDTSSFTGALPTLAAIRFCSACRMSGRRSSSCDGNPVGRSWGGGASAF